VTQRTQTSWSLVCKLTIPTELPSFVEEVSATFGG
jgi:hypothetical protein